MTILANKAVIGVLQIARAFKAIKLPSIQDRVLQNSGLDKIFGETEITTSSTVKVYIAKNDKDSDKYIFVDEFGRKLGYIKLWICKNIVLTHLSLLIWI